MDTSEAWRLPAALNWRTDRFNHPVRAILKQCFIKDAVLGAFDEPERQFIRLYGENRKYIF